MLAVLAMHPVSALTEFCFRQHLMHPVYELIENCGPAHRKTFRYKVLSSFVDNVTVFIFALSFLLNVIFIA